MGCEIDSGSVNNVVLLEMDPRSQDRSAAAMLATPDSTQPTAGSAEPSGTVRIVTTPERPSPAEATRWIIRGERLVDDSRRARVSIAEVELPDGVRFEQWLLRLPRAAVVVVLNDRDEVLMMWRHRFIIDRWVWELPGGYVDDEQEDVAVTAAREVEEETGWRPGPLEPLLAFQPMVGTVDSENLLFLARGADYTGPPSDINEAEQVAWIPLGSVSERMARGEIVGSSSIIGLLRVLTLPRHQRLAD
jgi:8-oxo-dGTP pyrophosphatase MutT (NUDIX family)